MRSTFLSEILCSQQSHFCRECRSDDTLYHQKSNVYGCVFTSDSLTFKVCPNWRFSGTFIPRVIPALIYSLLFPSKFKKIFPDSQQHSASLTSLSFDRSLCLNIKWQLFKTSLSVTGILKLTGVLALLYSIENLILFIISNFLLFNDTTKIRRIQWAF